MYLVCVLRLLVSYNQNTDQISIVICNLKWEKIRLNLLLYSQPAKVAKSASKESLMVTLC
jgi:hypothetical protein